MPFLAPLEIEVRTTGNDANGGGFDPISGIPGTDFSQQDAAEIAYTDLVIDATTNTKFTSAGNPVTAAHVGNIVNITGGTGFTVQRVQIISQAAGVATCDKSLGTLGSTGGTGNLGGGLLTIGMAGSLPIVAGNTIWIKWHTTNVYTSTSTTVNIANGRLSATVGTAADQLTIQGYDVTHGDDTGNRPTLRWGVNAASLPLILCTGVTVLKNIILDGNRANFTNTRGFQTSAVSIADNVKVMGTGAGGFIYAGGSHLHTKCELTDWATTAAIFTTVSSEIQVADCYIHDGTTDAMIMSGAILRWVVINTIFDTTTGRFIVQPAGATDGPEVYNCVFYNASSHAIDTASDNQTIIENCIFESNGGFGINTSAGGLQKGIILKNNAFFNNTSGKYDTTEILPANVSGEVINTTGTFFVDAPNQNFSLNNTANQGALARAVANPTTFPGSATISYRDIGAAQHQDSGGATTNIFNILE